MINVKYQLQHGMKNLIYLMDHVLYKDIQDYFEYILKRHETATDNPLIRTYMNKIENRITFKIKTGYYLNVLTQEIMRFLRSTKSKINKNEKGEIMPHL